MNQAKEVSSNDVVGVGSTCHCINLAVNVFVFDGAVLFVAKVFFGGEIGLAGAGNHGVGFGELQVYCGRLILLMALLWNVYR